MEDSKRQETNIYHLTWSSDEHMEVAEYLDTVDYNEGKESVDGEIKNKGEENKEPTNLNAKYALLMDATNRRVLFEKSGYEQVPMASTTKIMTLLVALENGNMNDIVTVSKQAACMPDVQLNMNTGEQYILSDLLYSLMLESHNDTAVAIAEHIGGSVEGFAAMMNEKAKELGAYHTNFVTPNGLDAEGHYTTAYDLALISSYAIENESFLQIVQTPSHTFHEQTTGRCFTVNNKDRFLTSYDGAIGIKTGFTNDAGYCFVGAVDKDNKRFVSVVLACGWPPNKSFKWKDTTQLMDYGIEQFHSKEILKAGTSFQQIPVLDSIEDKAITPFVNDSIRLLLREGEQVSFDVKLPTQLKAPVKKNETVGEIIVYVNDEKYQVLPLYSNDNRSKITYEYILKQIIFQYFLVVQ
ncbi:MAG: D-alanyl-D-alanine carboxypeptidase [Lachnospiraceae bacterium]|nr:D-alanyl-D-alanine carboxypeptidase [Lachnospiraceae bacterium]